MSSWWFQERAMFAVPDEPGPEQERVDVARHESGHITYLLRRRRRVVGADVDYGSGNTYTTTDGDADVSLRAAMAGAAVSRSGVNGSDAASVEAAARSLGYDAAAVLDVADEVRETMNTPKMRRAVDLFTGLLAERGELSEDEIRYYGQVVGLVERR